MWPGLRRVLLRIGRWLLRTIADAGIKGLIIYMRQRVRVFARRLGRVLHRKRHSLWRVSWLRGRIRRWKAAIRWLQGRQAQRLKGRVLKAAMKRAAQEIPDQAPDEDFGRWKRRAA
jgi:hypothetical protein